MTAPALLAELHAAGIRCHCAGDRTGHPVGVVACAAPKITRTSMARPEVGRDPDPLFRPAEHRPVGTCTECGRPDVRIQVITMRTAHPEPSGHPLNVGVRVADVPELAAHKRPGRGGASCPGRIIGEARFRFPELEAIVRDYGPASVTR